eukprot:TRINITY_DN13714_c0_g2_i2.p1 TRINITY_DN13714_c0_g2~~TRINITY_DN13714_c0_g2_i2.p1  ORF type:complete len:101 (-),score=27.72 TRINITY_DN13714_c0_g2_i2:71-373(-)
MCIRDRNKSVPKKTSSSKTSTAKKILYILKKRKQISSGNEDIGKKLWKARNSLGAKHVTTNEAVVLENESDKSDDCQTVIEYNCENDYSLLFDSLNNLVN